MRNIDRPGAVPALIAARSEVRNPRKDGDLHAVCRRDTVQPDNPPATSVLNESIAMD